MSPTSAALAAALLFALGEATPPEPPTEAQLNEMSLRELSIARNTMFAKHGRTFSTEWVDAFFKKQPWYRPNPKFAYDQLTPSDRAFVRKVKEIENGIDPEQLRLRRNTVFARRGRVFKSADLREHFKKQPWYREDPSYSDERLTAEDKIEIKLIQALEQQAAAVPSLKSWAPGQALSSKPLQGADLNAIFEFYVDVVGELRVAGFGGEMCEVLYSEDRCGRLQGSDLRTRTALPKIDAATLTTVERALAIAHAKDRVAHWEHGGHSECWMTCDEDEAGRECKSCRQTEAKYAKGELKRWRARLAKARKGDHSRGQELFDEVASVFLEAMA